LLLLPATVKPLVCYCNTKCPTTHNAPPHSSQLSPVSDHLARRGDTPPQSPAFNSQPPCETTAIRTA
jgi:hypothetical protein